MGRGADKVLAALACAVLIGALGALSWRGEQNAGLMIRGIYGSEAKLDKSDEVVQELERIQTFWRNNDTGTGNGKGSAGNP